MENDFLDMEHFHEEGRPYLSMRERAAQFVAYKALDGFEEEIEEAERLRKCGL